MDHPLWGFTFALALVVFTQWVILRRDRKAHLSERETELYLRMLDDVVELMEIAESSHQLARHRRETGSLDDDPELAERRMELRRRIHRLILHFRLMGSIAVMDSFMKLAQYCENVEEYESEQAFLLSGEVGYAMCCDVHGEKPKGPKPPS